MLWACVELSFVLGIQMLRDSTWRTREPVQESMLKGWWNISLLSGTGVWSWRRHGRSNPSRRCFIWSRHELRRYDQSRAERGWIHGSGRWCRTQCQRLWFGYQASGLGDSQRPSWARQCGSSIQKGHDWVPQKATSWPFAFNTPRGFVMGGVKQQQPLQFFVQVSCSHSLCEGWLRHWILEKPSQLSSS